MKRFASAIGLSALLLATSACTTSNSDSGSPSATIPSASATLPADWPKDLPAPQGLTLRSVTPTTVAGRTSTTAVYQGNSETVTIMNQLATELKADGYVETNTVANPPTLIVSNWTNSDSRLGVNASSTGGLTLVTMTYSAN